MAAFTGAEASRVEGNEHFKSGRYFQAGECYVTALDKLVALKASEDGASLDVVREAQIKCRLNRSACLLKLHGYEAARAECAKVVELDETNAKGHYRLGQAYVALCMFTEAQDSFKQSIKLNPQLREPRKELDELKARLKVRT